MSDFRKLLTAIIAIILLVTSNNVSYLYCILSQIMYHVYIVYILYYVLYYCIRLYHIIPIMYYIITQKNTIL